MANKISDINSYSLKSSDIFFFDNNVWMYIFCPLANFNRGRQQKIYSKFFENLLSRNLHIYTNSLILSEFSNRYLRLDFDLARSERSYKGEYDNYKKHFVGSPRFIATVKELKIVLNQITKICQRCSDEFNSINLDEVMDSFEHVGFNDSYYIHLAAKKNWIIVTDDSDFTNKKIPEKNLHILTII